MEHSFLLKKLRYFAKNRDAIASHKNACAMACYDAAEVIEDLVDIANRLVFKTLGESREPAEKLKVVLDDGAILPTRAHADDAGLDLYARENFRVGGYLSRTTDTGVHIQIPPGYVGILLSKSGLNVNHNITNEGVIDAGYTGSIKVKLYNHGAEDYIVNAGDKISQLVILPIITPEVEAADKLEVTERGNNGFGSSGR